MLLGTTHARIPQNDPLRTYCITHSLSVQTSLWPFATSALCLSPCTEPRHWMSIPLSTCTQVCAALFCTPEVSSQTPAWEEWSLPDKLAALRLARNALHHRDTAGSAHLNQSKPAQDRPKPGSLPFDTLTCCLYPDTPIGVRLPRAQGVAAEAVSGRTPGHDLPTWLLRKPNKLVATQLKATTESPRRS